MFSFCNQVVFKITKACNLRCTYCYIKHKEDYEGQKMEFEDVKVLLHRIVEDRVKNDNKDHFHLTFHGGEPTVVGHEYLYKVCAYAKNLFEINDLPLEFSMQSNLTLFDDKMLKVIKEFNIQVGGSYDGLGTSNSLRTEDFNDKDYLSILNNFKKYSIMRPGLLSVITKANIKSFRAIQKYMAKTLGQSQTKANIVEDVITEGKSPIEVTGLEFFEYIYKPAIETFLKKKSLETIDSNVDRLLEQFFKYSFLGEVPYSEKVNCGAKYCGAGLNVIEVDPNGKIYACGRYSEEGESSYVGSIFEEDFFNLKQITKHMELTRQKQLFIRDHKMCDTCFASPICDRGCMAFHYSKFGTWGIRRDLVCARFQPLMEYMLLHQKEIIKAYILAKGGNQIPLIRLDLLPRPKSYADRAQKVSRDLGLSEYCDEVNFSANDKYLLLSFKIKD